MLLRHSVTSGELEDFLYAWWIDLEGRGDALTDKGSNILDLTKALILAVDQTLDQTQRAYLLARIRGYHDAFASLVN